MKEMMSASAPGRRFCPRCQWTKQMFEAERIKIQDYVDNIPEEDRVSQEQYEARLQACGRCPELRAGLCGQCGCYVAVRAARKIGYCPHVKPRWEAESAS